MKSLIHIYGASGSGMSTPGRYLSEKFNFAFLDFDDYFRLSTGPKSTNKRPIAENAAHVEELLCSAN